MHIVNYQDLDRILQKFPFSYQSLDGDGYILNVNKNWLNLMGYADENEVIGKNILNFLAPKEIAKLEFNFSLLIERGEIHVAEYEIIRKDGNHIFISLDGIVDYDEHGNVLRTHCFLRDITNDKKMYKKINKTRQRAELYLNLAGVIIVAINKEGIITLMNKKGYDVLEYNEGELIGKNWFKTCLPPSLKEEVYDVFKSLMNGEIEPMEFFENPILTKNEEEKIIAWHNTVIYDDSGNIAGTLSAGEDITKLKRLRTELLDRSSHELKTPLTTIKGNTELLLNIHKDEINPNLLPLIEDINRNAIKLEYLIGHILDSSALKAGVITINPTFNNLSTLIRECIKDLQILIIKRGISVKLKIDDELITQFDYRKIYNVINNLLMNAIKYTPSYGRIEIKSKILDDSFLISVEDNGIGFTEEEKSRIFTRFGKIERYGKGWDVEIEGVGLG